MSDLSGVLLHEARVEVGQVFAHVHDVFLAGQDRGPTFEQQPHKVFATGRVQGCWT